MSLSSAFCGTSLKAFPVPGKGTTSSTATRQVTSMAKKKGVRIIVTLECTEARALGKTPSRYTTQKNRRNSPDRLELKKYNRFLRRHTLHREIK